MKKFFILLIAAASIGLISSCKSREKCPAYGKMTPKAHSGKLS